MISESRAKRILQYVPRPVDSIVMAKSAPESTDKAESTDTGSCDTRDAEKYRLEANGSAPAAAANARTRSPQAGDLRLAIRIRG